MSVTSYITRQLANGRMLKNFDGENVSIMLKVEDETGKTLTGISTDKIKVRVQLQDSLHLRKGSWVEVIGKVNSGDSMRAREVIPFSNEDANDFDEEGYNMMVLFMNNCKQIFKFSAFE